MAGKRLDITERYADGGLQSQELQVYAQSDNFGNIDAVFAPAMPEDETPTGESLSAVAQRAQPPQKTSPEAVSAWRCWIAQVGSSPVVALSLQWCQLQSTEGQRRQPNSVV